MFPWRLWAETEEKEGTGREQQTRKKWDPPTALPAQILPFGALLGVGLQAQEGSSGGSQCHSQTPEATQAVFGSEKGKEIFTARLKMC